MATERGLPWRAPTKSKQHCSGRSAYGIACRRSIFARSMTGFTEIIDSVIRRAALQRGQQVLDLGTGTGSVAVGAASAVMPGGGTVTGMDISPEMLRLARQRAASMGLSNITFLEGRAEAIPTPSGRFDAVLASLSLMYVIDRGAAARFAPKPPVPGVGPGALADAAEFLAQLESAGIRASLEAETTSFAFTDFSSAWDVLAGVTAAQLSSERQEAARAAVRAQMWPAGDGPRRFNNLTQFIIGTR